MVQRIYNDGIIRMESDGVQYELRKTQDRAEWDLMLQCLP